MTKLYIHYGKTEYHPELVKPIKNEDYFTKPRGGLWASDVNAEYGWKAWCENENFRECDPANSFIFKLKPEANVITIDSMEILNSLPTLPSKGLFGGFGNIYLDFEAMVKSGIDAVEVSISKFSQAYHLLYGWDCDSIVVLNKEAILT